MVKKIYRIIITSRISEGYFASSGKFRSDDIKVGNILACVSSSSSVTYFPSEVTLNDEESYPIQLKVLENPRFAEGGNYQIQQGAGMLVLKSDEKEQLASAEFLKWFTEEQQNIAFSTASGYLPVKKAANHIEEVEKVTAIEDSVKEVLTTSFQMIETNHMYTLPPFAQGTNAREVLDTSMKNLASQDRQTVQENLKAGMTLDEAVSSFETEVFEKWYERQGSAFKTCKVAIWRKYVQTGKEGQIHFCIFVFRDEYSYPDWDYNFNRKSYHWRYV